MSRGKGKITEGKLSKIAGYESGDFQIVSSNTEIKDNIENNNLVNKTKSANTVHSNKRKKDNSNRNTVHKNSTKTSEKNSNKKAFIIIGIIILFLIITIGNRVKNNVGGFSGTKEQDGTKALNSASNFIKSEVKIHDDINNKISDILVAEDYKREKIKNYSSDYVNIGYIFESNNRIKNYIDEVESSASFSTKDQTYVNHRINMQLLELTPQNQGHSINFDNKFDEILKDYDSSLKIEDIRKSINDLGNSISGDKSCQNSFKINNIDIDVSARLENGQMMVDLEIDKYIDKK